jgi:N-terminal domain of argonaute
MATPQGGPARVMERPTGAACRGSAGRPITLDANFFRLAVRGLPTVYQHSVDLTAERRPRGWKDGDEVVARKVSADQPVSVNRNVFRRFMADPALAGVRMSYDGRKIAYSATRLPDGVCGRDFRIACDRETEAPPAGAPRERVDWVVVVVEETAVLQTAQALDGRGVIVDGATQPVIAALDVALAEGGGFGCEC